MTDALVSYLEGAAPWAIPLVMHPVMVLAAKVVMGLAAAALVVALASQVWVLVWRRRTRGMPGPGYWWLCGHLRDYHDASVKLAAKYGGIYNVFLGLRTMTVVSDPALLKERSQTKHQMDMRLTRVVEPGAPSQRCPPSPTQAETPCPSAFCSSAAMSVSLSELQSTVTFMLPARA